MKLADDGTAKFKITVTAETGPLGGKLSGGGEVVVTKR